MIVRKEALMHIHQIQTAECQIIRSACRAKWQCDVGTNSNKRRCTLEDEPTVNAICPQLTICTKRLAVTASRLALIEDAIVRACDQPPTNSTDDDDGRCAKIITLKHTLMQIHQMETNECQARLQQCVLSSGIPDERGTTNDQRCKKDKPYVKCLANLAVTASQLAFVQEANIIMCAVSN